MNTRLALLLTIISAWFVGCTQTVDTNETTSELVQETSFSAGVRSANQMREAEAHYEKGVNWQKQGEIDKAIVEYSEAIGLYRRYSAAYNNRATIWLKKGNVEMTIVDLKKSIRFKPSNATVLDNLARLLAIWPDASYRDGTTSIEYASRACQLALWEHAEYIDTLAAAHAEIGDFEKAVSWQETAIEKAPDDRLPGYRARLELYKAGKPLRADNFGKESGNKGGVVGRLFPQL